MTKELRRKRRDIKQAKKPEFSWCEVDSKREEVVPGTFCVCFECGHVFISRQKVVDDYAEYIKPVGQGTRITFCPLCLHDFPFTVVVKKKEVSDGRHQ